MKYIYNKRFYSFLSGVTLTGSPTEPTYYAQLSWDNNVSRAMGFDSIDCAISVYDLLIELIDFDLDGYLTIIDLHDTKAGTQVG